jgi:hypothetical protein
MLLSKERQVMAEHGNEVSRLRFERDVAVAALREIKRATIEGRVCDDVAWFDEITTLHDFCDEVLSRVKGASDHG